MPVKTRSGTCLGLVASGKPFRFPREILALKSPNRFLVVDMGGWAPPNRGQVFLLDASRKPTALKPLLTDLTLPHGIAWGPDGKVYVGEMGRIIRFDPPAAHPTETVEAVVGGLPTKLREKNLHPLAQFVFGKSETDRWDLYVNVGAPTDACAQHTDSQGACTDTEKPDAQAAVRQYRYLGEGRWDSKYEVLARGLRNSMALLTHDSGTVLQFENSRDLPSPTEPFEEINVLKAGRHYGWPYCHDFRATSPEWRNSKAFLCDPTKNPRYEIPWALMPPHVAPLDALYYDGAMFPEWAGRLLVSWHGYVGSGQRIVSYETDGQGRPRRTQPEFVYGFNTPEAPQGVRWIRAEPRGGPEANAPYEELVSGWSAMPGVRARGAPVGMTLATDGSLWIVDDKNKSVLRLTRGQAYEQSENTTARRSQDEISRILALLRADPQDYQRWQGVRSQIIVPKCVSCHSGFGSKSPGGEPEDLRELRFILSQPGWLEIGQPAKSLVYTRLLGEDGTLAMPPGSPLPGEARDGIREWIEKIRQ